MIVQWKKPYIFFTFHGGGGGTDPLLHSGSAHDLVYENYVDLPER